MKIHQAFFFNWQNLNLFHRKSTPKYVAAIFFGKSDEIWSFLGKIFQKKKLSKFAQNGCNFGH
jgi:hypothetical protein